MAIKENTFLDVKGQERRFEAFLMGLFFGVLLGFFGILVFVSPTPKENNTQSVVSPIFPLPSFEGDIRGFEQKP